MIELRFDVAVSAPERERGEAAAVRAVQRFLLALAVELVSAAARLGDDGEAA